MTSTWDGKTKESIYIGNGFKATFKLQTNLLADFYATIKLENTGDTKIENWAWKRWKQWEEGHFASSLYIILLYSGKTYRIWRIQVGL